MLFKFWRNIQTYAPLISRFILKIKIWLKSNFDRAIIKICSSINIAIILIITLNWFNIFVWVSIRLYYLCTYPGTSQLYITVSIALIVLSVTTRMRNEMNCYTDVPYMTHVKHINHFWYIYNINLATVTTGFMNIEFRRLLRSLFVKMNNNALLTCK